MIGMSNLGHFFEAMKPGWNYRYLAANAIDTAVVPKLVENGFIGVHVQLESVQTCFVFNSFLWGMAVEIVKQVHTRDREGGNSEQRERFIMKSHPYATPVKCIDI